MKRCASSRVASAQSSGYRFESLDDVNIPNFASAIVATKKSSTRSLLSKPKGLVRGTDSTPGQVRKLARSGISSNLAEKSVHFKWKYSPHRGVPCHTFVGVLDKLDNFEGPRG